MKRITSIIALLASSLLVFGQNSNDSINDNLGKEKSESEILAFNKAIDTDSNSYKDKTIQEESQSPQKGLFEKLANNKSITTVYVSKTMLSMASGFVPDIGNIRTKDLPKKIDQIEIYTSEKKSGCREMTNETSTLSKNKNYELLMHTKDDDDDVTFYGVKNGDAFKEMIMITKEGEDECTIIRMIGNFTLEDIQKVVGNN